MTKDVPKQDIIGRTRLEEGTSKKTIIRFEEDRWGQTLGIS